MQEEISILSKKNPDGKMNTFKIKHINQLLCQANELLGDKYIPMQGFTVFDEELLPSNSDVVFMLSQYINCMEELKIEHVVGWDTNWHWKINGLETDIRTSRPKKTVR